MGLQVNALKARHGRIEVCRDIAFTAGDGEFLIVLGPNGAGKSSLLHEVARPRTRGTVEVAGLDVATLKPRTRRAAVALVPESSDDLLFTTTVAAECRRADRRSGRPGTADTFLGFLGIGDHGDTAHLMSRHPRDLSAGERLCLVIAIQLSSRPRLLLIDEPTRGLDAAARELVGTALVHAAGTGAAVMVATHDGDFAARFATRTVTMSAGRIDAAIPVGSS
jgi:ABC-type cobalamin/Fe3+-siderophores transport system ATPase subunit